MLLFKFLIKVWCFSVLNNATWDQNNWIDITKTFNENVKGLVLYWNFKLLCIYNYFTGLKLGELLHDEFFGLFEAMSAIEMMDPKMDAGMLCNRGTRKIVSFEQAVNVNMPLALWFIAILWFLIIFRTTY